ncbi:MAG TPA: cellulose biosynthesis cyclic di-GMP-binding regulatory protein BcsB, partial [Dehalococcoidia bacterium]|nr:cellulose biosynthesis cyclic di-GMP-binding regulatory protein BcsB [Dehalococcoidia bacterium]
MSIRLRPAALLLLAMAALAPLALPTGSTAQVPVTDFTFADLGIEDIRSTGIVSSQTVRFPGPGDVRLAPDGSYLALGVSHSELLDPELSTMTVTLNGFRLRSFRLDATNAQGATLGIPVHASQFRRGTNELRVDFYLRMRQCEAGPEDPSRYAIVDNASAVHYAYATDEPKFALQDFSLSTFPYPFYHSGYVEQPQTTVVVPREPSEDELSAAMDVAVALGRSIGQQAYEPQLVTVDAFDRQSMAAHHLILIGTPERNPLVAEFSAALPVRAEDNRLVATDGSKLPAHFAALSLGRSPLNNERGLLLVTATDGAALPLASGELIRNAGDHPLTGPYALYEWDRADDQARNDPEPVDGSLRLTFGELGIDETTVSGFGPNIVTVPFYAPRPIPGSASTLRLQLSHANVLDLADSALRVELNGEVVATELLPA